MNITNELMNILSNFDNISIDCFENEIYYFCIDTLKENMCLLKVETNVYKKYNNKSIVFETNPFKTLKNKNTYMSLDIYENEAVFTENQTDKYYFNIKIEPNNKPLSNYYIINNKDLNHITIKDVPQFKKELRIISTCNTLNQSSYITLKNGKLQYYYDTNNKEIKCQRFKFELNSEVPIKINKLQKTDILYTKTFEQYKKYYNDKSLSNLRDKNKKEAEYTSNYNCKKIYNFLTKMKLNKKSIIELYYSKDNPLKIEYKGITYILAPRIEY